MKINVQNLTTKDLENGKYKDFLPEFYELIKVIENSLWHKNQSVFDHVVLVYEKLLEVLELNFIGDIKRNEIKKHLNEIIGRKTRKELLLIGTLLHDNAKIDTSVKNEDGIIYCPLHELIGANRIKNFSERLDLTRKEEVFVKNIVLYHGFTSEILNLIILTNKYKKYLQLFKETVNGIGMELLILMLSDLKGSDLKKNAKEEFYKREKLLIKIIKEYEI